MATHIFFLTFSVESIVVVVFNIDYEKKINYKMYIITSNNVVGTLGFFCLIFCTVEVLSFPLIFGNHKYFKFIKHSPPSLTLVDIFFIYIRFVIQNNYHSVHIMTKST